MRPFSATKEHGMGMGLSIARTIVEAHGGQKWADSQYEHGAVFRFSLSLAKSH
jgi:signal transduction histidine kinase